MATVVKTVQTVSSKGQVTIPIAPRRKLGIEPGTALRFVERDGMVVLEKVETSLKSLCGMLTARAPLDIEKIDDVIAQAVAYDAKRVDTATDAVAGATPQCRPSRTIPARNMIRAAAAGLGEASTDNISAPSTTPMALTVSLGAQHCWPPVRPPA